MYAYLDDAELDPFPLNPELPNTQSPIAAQFNLSSLFQNASAIIDYTVTQNGQTTSVVNQQVLLRLYRKWNRTVRGDNSICLPFINRGL